MTQLRSSPARSTTPTLQTPAMAALSAHQDGDVSRGRPRTRYPSHLTPDGIPRKPYLHRRGTSKTLESLEDLLREAGYKETRVFSAEPDADRTGELDPSSQSSRVSAVVGFIANLMPLSTRSLGRAAGVQVANASAPTIRVDPAHSQSRESSRSPRAISPACASSSSSLTVRPSDLLRPTQSTPAAAGPSSAQHRNIPYNTRTALLRHAASSPAFARSKSHSTPRRKRMVTAPNKIPPVPSIPDTWIATLAKALVGPSPSPFGDRTNARNARSYSIRIRRSSPAEGAVSRTNVTCRSTPASRSSSCAPPPVPMLTLTRTENDEWAAPSADVSLGDDSLMDDEDEDSDGEVNLARILAPRPLARRQRSIVSLRRNLQTSITQVRAERHSRAGGERTWGTNDFDDEGFPVASSGAANQRPGKKRRALPSWGPDDV